MPRSTPRPLRWFTLQQVAVRCKRSPKTIENLVAQHQVPRRLGWMVKQRKRRRHMLFSPDSLRLLQDLTLFRTPRSHRLRQNGQSVATPHPVSDPPTSAAPAIDGPAGA